LNPGRSPPFGVKTKLENSIDKTYNLTGDNSMERICCSRLDPQVTPPAADAIRDRNKASSLRVLRSKSSKKGNAREQATKEIHMSMLWFLFMVGTFVVFLVALFVSGSRIFEQKRARALVANPARGRYQITYTDREGATTSREIDVKQVDLDGNHYVIKAHCSLRKATRVFLDQNITEAVNLDTGKTVPSVAQDAMEQAKGQKET
jgi:hypothetical protein